jgi:hypothetical protein
MHLQPIALALILAGCSSGNVSQTSAAATQDDPTLDATLDEALLEAQKQACATGTPDPRACDPSDTSKTTICHVPPGNPANAHTVCVGNAAVPAHRAHGDSLGACVCTVGGAPGGSGAEPGGGGDEGHGGSGEPAGGSPPDFAIPPSPFL